jgi:hypothetical protein
LRVGSRRSWRLPTSSNVKAGKQQLTPEQRAILEMMVAGAFSSIAVHAIGDRLAKGLHKAADGVQWATDKTAYGAGVAQLTAFPAAKHVWGSFTGLFATKPTATAACI